MEVINMAGFKLNIADPKEKKCYKTEVKDAQAAPFMGLNIGEKIEGVKVGIEGYEFMVTGGTDYCGFPMRRGILGVRKKLVIYPGVGFKGGLKGMKKRKTVCGHKINESITAINLKVTKEGAKKLSELFGKKEGAKEEPKKEEKPKEAKKVEVKEEKPKDEKKEVKEKKKPEVKEEKQAAKEQKAEPKEAEKADTEAKK
jgi:small subunit ribosomal protein S6e